MKNRIRIARGTKAQINDSNTNIPVNNDKVAAGVPIYTIDEKKLYISDGTQKPSDLVGINATGAEKLINISNGSVSDQSSTAGKLIYIKNGKPEEYSLPDDNNSTQVISLDSDSKITKSIKTIGSSKNPIYLNQGQLSTITDTVGGTIGNPPNQTTYPVYLNNGVITALEDTLTNNIHGHADTVCITETSGTSEIGPTIWLLKSSEYTGNDFSVAKNKTWDLLSSCGWGTYDVVNLGGLFIVNMLIHTYNTNSFSIYWYAINLDDFKTLISHNVKILSSNVSFIAGADNSSGSANDLYEFSDYCITTRKQRFKNNDMYLIIHQRPDRNQYLDLNVCIIGYDMTYNKLN